MLYTVCIGDIEAASLLGQFKVSEENKIVSVKSFDFGEWLNCADDNYSATYRMMDDIN